jgi:small-conductance mechanosensitive channel
MSNPTDPLSLDPQLRDVQQRKQEDAMRATIARLVKELAEAEADRDKALNRCAEGVHVEEYVRVRTELSEALAGRDREYNRAEAEREKANEWLGQLTDAKKQIADTRKILGARTDESLEQVAGRRMTFPPMHDKKPFRPEKGTLVDVFTRVQRANKSPTKPVGRVIPKPKTKTKTKKESKTR